ncbi:MAG: ectoine hydroxylase-related dioxygenase (phytanoyl-CoA dioxygenase family) [Parasphingorhabdus sp.]|jgi:ectoine hydroxylase-related dioxygenase (phytanoyl-CoA dioxygenase family)
MTKVMHKLGLGANNQVPAQAINDLEQDGVICLREAFSAQWLEVIEHGIDLALNGASTDVDIVKRASDEGSFSFSSGAWREVEPFKKFIFESQLADIAWTLLDTKSLVLFYDFLLIKQPRSDNAATPWHQDHSYYPLDGTKVINCWVALDEIPVESALSFLPGSHQPGKLYRAVDFENPQKDYSHVRRDLPLPPLSNDDIATDIVTCPMSPGDMLVWKSYTLHSAPGNKLDRRRAALSVSWLGDDIVYKDVPSLETYRDPSLVPGQPMNCEKFPQVRSG